MQYKLEFYILEDNGNLTTIPGMRKTCTDEDRSWPSYICKFKDKIYRHYKDEIINNVIKVYCIPDGDPRLAEIKMVKVMMYYDFGQKSSEWWPLEKYTEGKKCSIGNGQFFTFGEIIKHGTCLDDPILNVEGGTFTTCIV